jgi:hypothetical protein
VYEYRAYGLNFRSELHLPELVASPGDPDVVVRFGEIDVGVTKPMRYVSGRWRVDPTEACLVYDGIGAFLIRLGREIVLRPEPGVAEERVRPLVIGTALAVLLVQRGGLVLHASAVGVDGRAAAFLGGPGWGKSTAAAALRQRGHRLVADDITSVVLDGDRHLVQPGFPIQRLSEETATALGHDYSTLRPLISTAQKRQHSVAGPFDDTPVVLDRLYVLADAPGPDVLIERLSGHNALSELIRHSHGASIVHESGLAAEHLRRCAQLVSTVPVSRLSRPRSFARLEAMVEAVERDVRDRAWH